MTEEGRVTSQPEYVPPENRSHALPSDTAELAKRFTYHPPRPDQVPRFETIRNEAHMLARLLTELCPDSRERSLALTHLDQVVMFANAAIARRE